MIRGSSVEANKTLNLSNFGSNQERENTGQPVVQKSSLIEPSSKFLNTDQKLKRPFSGLVEQDSLSAGLRSTTTVGGGLANRISQTISRILTNKSNCEQTDEDLVELENLIDEINQHQDLTVKLSSTSKIAKILQEVSSEKDVIAEIQQSKQIRLGAFQSKLRLEMKTVDPRVRLIMEQCRKQLEQIQTERDAEIEEFIENHSEVKFKANQDLKKKFQLKIAFATKQGDQE